MSGRQLVKTYSQRRYVHTTLVQHQGVTVAFAMDDARRVFYSVLDMSRDTGDGLDTSYWADNPSELRFPSEIAKVGYAAAGAVTLPLIKRGGRVEAGAERLLPEEIDPFLSSTARLAASAPFQVVSDGTNIVVFRQSIDAAHPDALFRAPSGGPVTETSGSGRVALVHNTLLCDRFVVSGVELRPLMEVRYQRSRQRAVPESSRDTLGTRDMEGRPFYEPTQELGFVANLTEGAFSVLLLPTQVSGVRRWQLFSRNSRTRRIDAFSVEQAGDGLFNTMGSQYYTSPDPAYAGAVFERAPGVDQFTGKPLVPVASRAGYAETALRFDGAKTYVDLGNSSKLGFTGPEGTVEAWIRPTAPNATIVAKYDEGGAGGSFALALADTGKLTVRRGGGALVESSRTVPMDAYIHVAVTFTDSRVLLFLDGEPAGAGLLPVPAATTTALLIGARRAGGAPTALFNGEIDELRIWDRARSAAELVRDRGQRLAGNEPGLIAYYRFDEGSGTALFDHTDGACDGTLVGGPTWVTSHAPIGDNSGLRRESFVFEGRTVISGLTSTLYFQQENAATGYGSEQKPVKRQARVLLAGVTDGPVPPGGVAGRSYVATLDLAVGRDGRLTQVPDQITLPVVGKPDPSRDLERISALEQAIKVLQTRNTADEAILARSAIDPAKVAAWESERTTTAAEVARLAALYDRENIVTNWSYRIRNAVDNSYMAAFVTAKGGYRLTATVDPSDAGLSLWSIRDIGQRSADGRPYYLLIPGGMATAPLRVSDARPEDPDGRQTTGPPTGGPDVISFDYGNQDKYSAQPRSGPWVHFLVRVADESSTEGEIVARFNGCRVLFRPMASAKDYPGTEPRYRTAKAEESVDPRAVRFVFQRQSLHSGVDVALQAARDKLSTLATDIDAARTLRNSQDEARIRLAAGRVELAAKLAELALLTSGAKGSADVALPMPYLGCDRQGLTYAGGLLAFAWTPDTPFLADSTVGHVALYFRGGEGQFFAAYYDTSVSRSSRRLPTQGAPLRLIGRDALVDLAATTITVTDGEVPARCTVTITTGTESETFRSVPRAPTQFAAVLNGNPDATTVLIGAVQRADASTLTLSAPSVAAVSEGAAIRVDGRAFLVADHTPAGAKTIALVPGSASSTRTTAIETGSEIRAIAYDFGWATASRAGVSLTSGSTRIRVEVLAAAETVTNGTAADLTAGRACQWRGEAPGRAFTFDGKQTRLALPVPLLAQVRTVSDLTLEAWLLPDRVIRPARALHADTGADSVDARYQLGVTPAPLMTALTFDGARDRVNCGPIRLDATDFTIEFWAKRQTVTGRGELMLAQGDVGSSNLVLHLGFRGDNSFVFGFYGNDLDIPTAYTDLQWHHWAAVYDRAASTQIMYRDGVEVGRRTVPAPYAGKGDLILGGCNAIPAPANVGMDDVRVWGRVRSGQEIDRDRDRRITGREEGLLGYWTFANKRAVDLSPAGRDGVLIGSPAQCASGLAGHQVFAALGDRFVRSRDAFPVNEWEHLAVSVRQSWAVRLDGRGFLDAGAPDALNIVGDLTIEVFLRVDRLDLIQGLISYGGLGDGEPGGVPYQLTLLADGTLRFSFEDLDGVPRHMTSLQGLVAGAFHRVAVVRKGAEVTFYINGNQAGSTRHEGSAPQGGPGPLEMGRIRVGTATAGLRGVLSEVRLWNVARASTDVCREASPRSSGLLAHFRFQENTGNVTIDSINSYRARLSGASWTRSPDPAGSPAQLYRNGEHVVIDAVPAGDELRAAGYGEAQFTLGGRTTGSVLRDAFSGVLEEVRIWRTVRTQEQILDNLFTRLKGEKDQLIACYSFDTDTGTPTTALRDGGLRGNHLTFGTTAGQQPELVLSTAPLSTDTAQVRSALSGVSTSFHERLSGSPAVAEYADAQFDARGTLGGVMKRCYGYRRGDAWILVTGYKIGNLFTEWISQAQFDPQIIGYIEGAPPVPSENLTGSGTPDLTGTSSVTFRQADAVNVTQASGTADGKNFAFKAELETEFKTKVQAVTAPLGIGFSRPAIDITAKLKFGGGYDFSHNWTSDNSVSKAVSARRDTSVKLTGAWEHPAKILNTGVGRRFLPANTGFAVVQSETVDIFAVRLAHNNALVSYRILPSPDIPRDWNIIAFPINPRYTKQGTLDGAIGSTDTGKVLDPDYPQAGARGEHSYFKPTESYSIKRRIQREQQRLRALYESISHEPPPATDGAPLARALSDLAGPSFRPPARRPDTAATGAVAKSLAQRDLANTYVWTAAGGFFAESTETTDVVTETMAGTYTTGSNATGSAGLGLDFGGAAININFELSGGASHSTTHTKSKEATRSFGLDVSCAPSGDLHRYDDRGQLVFGADGRPAKVPGKVDAYRFMTFYLDADKSNFEDFFGKVVDPVWLAQSNDNNAAALRRARQSDKKPPCWRIMHRVTFVSRILQAVAPPTATPLEKAMRAENIESNYELIKRLEPYVRESASSLDELTAATEKALTRHLPELLPSAKEITDYLAHYYGTV
ncbi:LamG-like jellyroll fold domain-containing protein [Nocardia jiangsuensis]|uniref:LamG-like jellyroll fold domain-containing protein n=1 Tax=Nocardia jiangsuensis TaxID=1691563 RepID=A0ABV8DT15_9NOCA